MKVIAKTLLACVMLAGTISAIATSKSPKNNTPAFSDGGPAPLCLPSEPNCPPAIPPAAK